MSHRSQTRVEERSFQVPDYAQFLNSMPDSEYRALKGQYNASSPRCRIETFEQCCFGLDDELREYLDIGSAAGFRSNPGEADLKRMLEMWLSRDANGEPDSRVAAQISAHYRALGFRPVDERGHYLSRSTPGPRGAGGSDRRRGQYSQGSHGSSISSRSFNRPNPSGRSMVPPPSRPAPRRSPGSQAPSDASIPRRREAPPPI